MAEKRAKGHDCEDDCAQQQASGRTALLENFATWCYAARHYDADLKSITNATPSTRSLPKQGCFTAKRPFGNVSYHAALGAIYSLGQIENRRQLLKVTHKMVAHSDSPQA